MTSLLPIPTTNAIPQWQPATWAIVKGARVLALRLQAGRYQQIEVSVVLNGFAIALLSATVAKLNQGHRPLNPPSPARSRLSTVLLFFSHFFRTEMRNRGASDVKFDDVLRSRWNVLMSYLKLIFGCLLSVVVTLTLALPAHAASSAAIRAYDDVQEVVQDFSGQSLVRSEFGDANFVGANFDRADLRGAVFNGAKLGQTTFRNVNFSDGIAYLTDFSNADLSNAIFNSAMLLKSSFKGATVTGADFSDAAIDRAQVIALCKTATGTNPVTGVDTRESLGCR